MYFDIEISDQMADQQMIDLHAHDSGCCLIDKFNIGFVDIV